MQLVDAYAGQRMNIHTLRLLGRDNVTGIEVFKAKIVKLSIFNI